MTEERVAFGLRIAKSLNDKLAKEAKKRKPPITRQALAVEILAKVLEVDCDIPKVGQPKKERAEG